jgi:MFS family permease
MLDVLRVPGMMKSLLVGATLIVTVDLLSSFIPVWAVAQSIPASVVGWLLALRALFTISSRFGMARLVERFGRKILLLVTISMAVVALAVLPFVNQWGAIPVMALLGVGLGLPQPITLAWMTLLAPPQARGAAFGVRMSMNRFAQVTLPLLVAAAAGPFGVIAVFWSTAAVLVGGVVVVALTRSTVLDQRGSRDDVTRDADSPDAD